MSKKEERKLKSLYFDVVTNQLVTIMLIDKVTVQFKYIKDNIETELTKDEVYEYLDSKRWIDPPEKKQEPPKKELTSTSIAPKIIAPATKASLKVYIESFKELKNGNQSLISCNKEVGWLEAELFPKDNKLEVNLEELNSEDIKKILEILNK